MTFLFFITICVNIGVGYLIHYAVFKSSRAYLTYDDGSERINVITQAQNQAVSVFNQFNIKALGLAGELSFNHPDQSNVLYEYVGVKFLYTPPIKRLGPFALPENFQYLFVY